MSKAGKAAAASKIQRAFRASPMKARKAASPAKARKTKEKPLSNSTVSYSIDEKGNRRTVMGRDLARQLDLRAVFEGREKKTLYGYTKGDLKETSDGSIGYKSRIALGKTAYKNNDLTTAKPFKKGNVPWNKGKDGAAYKEAVPGLFKLVKKKKAKDPNAAPKTTVAERKKRKDARKAKRTLKERPAKKQ